MSETKINRREALRSLGAISAITVVLPGTLWGCGENDIQTSDVSTDPYVLGRVRYMEETSRVQFYSADNEGSWLGKAASHVPVVTIVGLGEIEVFTNHEMTVVHHITAHYVRDADTGTILGFQDYSAMDPAALATFKVPRGVKRITVHSHCNQHENWVARDHSLDA